MGRYRVGEWPGDQCAMKTLCASRAHNEMKDQWPWGGLSHCKANGLGFSHYRTSAWLYQVMAIGKSV